MPFGFFGGSDSATVTPEGFKSRRRFNQQLMEQGSSTAPVKGGWVEAIARALQGGLGGYFEGQTDREEKAARGAVDADLAKAWGGGSGEVAQTGAKDYPPLSTTTSGVDKVTGALATTPTFARIEGSQPSRKASGLGANALIDQGTQDAQYLVAKGYSPAAAAGIVGHLATESGLRTGAEAKGDQRDGSSSRGIAQWDPNRYQNMVTFARATGRDPSDRQAQLDFIDHELKNTETRAYAGLQAAKTPEEATSAFMHYERPAGYTPQNPAGGMAYGQRAGTAGQIYTRLASGNQADMPAPGAQTTGFVIPGQDAPAPAATTGSATDRITSTLAGSPQMQAAMKVATSPFATEGQRSVATLLLQKGLSPAETKTVDLGDAVGILGPSGNVISRIPKTTPAQFQTMESPDGTKRSVVFDPRTRTATDPVTGQPIAAMPPSATPMFKGNSVEAQGLNHLVTTGAISKDQAADLAAGKTITNPADGSVIFMTPSGLVRRPAEGAAPTGQPAGSPVAGPPAASPGVPQPPTPQSTLPAGAVQITPPKADKGPTEDQGKARGFVEKMVRAESNLRTGDHEATLLSGTDALAKRFPGGNYAISPEYRQANQAQEEFVTALLRRESGAAVSPDEFRRYAGIYFPQPGDDPATVAQKRQSREVAIQGMAASTGQGYKSPEIKARESKPEAAGAPMRVQNADDYAKVPPGGLYVDPDGHTKRKGGGRPTT